MIQRQNNETDRKTDQRNVSEITENGYFETYAHYGIHHDMLTVSSFIYGSIESRYVNQCSILLVG